MQIMEKAQQLMELARREALVHDRVRTPLICVPDLVRALIQPGGRELFGPVECEPDLTVAKQTIISVQGEISRKNPDGGPLECPMFSGRFSRRMVAVLTAAVEMATGAERGIEMSDIVAALVGTEDLASLVESLGIKVGLLQEQLTPLRQAEARRREQEESGSANG